MNRGYLGDVRDLFKFDLIKEIIRGFEKIDRFTYIPMLTNDDDKHGNIRNFEGKLGNKNRDLKYVLHKYQKIEKNNRSFNPIKEYFQKLGKEIRFYNETEIFKDDTRVQYFKNIPPDLMFKSLIFVDPDIGLQSKSPNEKHILYWEVGYLYDI